RRHTRWPRDWSSDVCSSDLARHVEAAPVAVGALESDIARGRIGANARQEIAQRHAGVLADHAPAFDADVLGDVGLLRQCRELARSEERRVGKERRCGWGWVR